ncbi:hypothetical protein HZ326_14541 [Fusarium oxysporum f. sp. albedinis]|nr:hypothetical protein HZ326_14541 [Fusarium oxysporum f. sp. albedinis]
MIDSRHALCLILSLEAVCPSIVCDHIEGSQVGLWIIGTTSSMECSRSNSPKSATRNAFLVLVLVLGFASTILSQYGDLKGTVVLQERSLGTGIS